MQAPDRLERHEADVVIMGGAFSGSAMGILLKRAQPDLKVLILESSSVFDRKVGESTSEVGAAFLTRILCLSSYLSRNQIAKQGLRLWFNRPGNACPERCSEIGGRYQSRLPAYQLDRSSLDSYLLELAASQGCEVWRPARVRSFSLEGDRRTVTVKRSNGDESLVDAKWLVDASGKAALIARQRGTLETVPDHPIKALWARFTEVADLDSYEMAMRYPEYSGAVHTARGAATNHLMGRGWWCWIIPLKNGEVSAGITWDPRIFTLPEDGTLGERLHRHLLSHPVGQALFEKAKLVEKDVRIYGNLPYVNSEVLGQGWAAVGDAAGFMDPLYSSGLDYCGHTVYAIHKIILEAPDGHLPTEKIVAYNRMSQRSYRRWLEALYIGKYHYLGDAELMWAAFLLDIAHYFIGPVRFVIQDPAREFARLPYDGKMGGGVARFMRFYNRRLQRIAERRHRCGRYGEANLDHRLLVEAGFAPNASIFKHLFRGLRCWLRCEWKHLWLRKPAHPNAAQPQPQPPPATIAESAAPGNSESYSAKHLSAAGNS